jgi:hypothetical protein
MSEHDVSWFETRGSAALLTMRRPHPEEAAKAAVSKDEAVNALSG